MVTILGFSSFLKEEFQGVIRIFWYVLEKDFHSFFQIRVYLSSKLVTSFQLIQFDKWWWSMPLLSLMESVFFLLLGSGSKCFSHFICLNLLSLFFWSLYTFIYISHVVLLQLECGMTIYLVYAACKRIPIFKSVKDKRWRVHSFNVWKLNWLDLVLYPWCSSTYRRMSE